jgi:hypothetical protein
MRKDTLVRLPEMTITITRNEDGNFLMTAPSDSFHTERYSTMLDVLEEWTDRQDAILEQWNNQGRQYPPAR